MRQYLVNTFVILLLILTFSFESCEKEGEYDLFPLKVGNEFYYSYYKYRFWGISDYTHGNETWKVISLVSEKNTIKYRIERRLDAMQTFLNDTVLITDKISYLEVVEESSSSLISAFGYTFKRYQDISVLEFRKQGSTSSPSSIYVFKADSGMTYYNYYHPPNQIVNESLHLDSLKIN